ncbi:MAG: PXPV repeat protein [Pseudomonadota bacterium]|nr:PXPV repeat protein [Pseudomonadota bacterium]
MNHSLTARVAAAAAIAIAALGASSPAQAHTDVWLTLGVPSRPAYIEPEPVYIRPVPRYVEPRPVYVAPPQYLYERDWRSSHESAHERERGWRHAEWRRRQWEHRHHEWDGFPGYGRDRD